MTAWKHPAGRIERQVRKADFIPPPPDAVGLTKYGTLPDARVELSEANIVTSIIEASTVPDSIFNGGGWHAPVIDIDVPCHYEPSSTPGHGHLYFDVDMTENQLMYLLNAMAEVGLVEPGYVRASEHRGYSAVRLPWVRKNG